MIPVCEPAVGEREAALVAECMRSGWISSDGQFVAQFEDLWADYCGRRHGIAVSNGTAALELAVRCVGVGPGDEVIIPAFTIISCALAVVRQGAVPVLVDSDPRTWCMDTSALEAKISPRTRAVMPVHIYGHPVNMGDVLDVAVRHDLRVIEDAAEAHGAEFEGRRCGSFGDVSCFSFYANKIVTTGEGGMVLVDDDGLAARARSLRDLAFRPDRRFCHDELGFNFRLGNVQAAIGVAQVETIDERLAAKRRLATAYGEALRDVAALRLPVEETWATNVHWMYGVVVDPEAPLGAEDLAAHLRDRGIQTRPFFLGMHEQPVFRGMGLFTGESHPVAEMLARQGLYLPSGTGLSDADVERVCVAIRDVLS